MVRDWTLSEADLVEIRQCRGDDNRLRFALQLCTLRLYGGFISDYDTAPLHIINHLGRQIGLPPVLLLGPSPRPATESEYQRRLRHYLDYRTFDATIQAELEQWLVQQARDGTDAHELFDDALDRLRSWKIIPPAISSLERLVASVATRTQDAVFERIAARLSPDLQQTIDDLLAVPAGEAKSPLFNLKAYPPEATPPAILSYLERERLLRALGVSDIDLSGLSPALITHFAQLVRYYDA